jgi:phosphoenolpyruvate phosphomutase
VHRVLEPGDGVDPALTTVVTTAVPTARYDVRRRKYKGEVSLIRGNEFYRLDEVADSIWIRCEGSSTLREIAESLAAAEDFTLGEAVAATIVAVEFFRRQGLIDIPCDAEGADPRDALVTRHKALFRLRSLVGVGVHNALSALMAVRHGFDFLWLSSFEVSAANGVPDAGLVWSQEVLTTVSAVRRATEAALVVDLDAGSGDVLKDYHLVRSVVSAGATAVCIEDNPVAKRSSLYAGYERELVSVDEQAARIAAARRAVDDEGLDHGVIARTEALVAGRGAVEAVERSRVAVDAGADAVFVQSLDPTGEEVLEFCAEWKRKTPVFLAPTRFSHIPTADLIGAGASHVIYANYGIRATHHALNGVFSRLRSAASAAEVEADISTVDDIAREVRLHRLRALEETMRRNGGTA